MHSDVDSNCALYESKHIIIPLMAVHASSGELCFASSSSVTGLGLPPLQPRSFLERHRRIQSRRLHPGPSLPRLAGLALLSALAVLVAAAPFAFGACGTALAPGNFLLIGQLAGRERELSAPESGSVIFFDLDCTVGLEGGVELVTKGEVGSWFRNKDDIVLFACRGFSSYQEPL